MRAALTAMFILSAMILFGLVSEAQEFHFYHHRAYPELESRVWTLENEVRDLERRLDLLSHSCAVKSEIETDRKWFCEVSAFGKKFKAFGATQVETREAVMDRCAEDSNEIHCGGVICRLNE